MGLFDKFKKKAQEGIKHVQKDVGGAADQNVVNVGGLEFQKVDEFTYDADEWQYYYKQPDHWGGMDPNNLDEFMYRLFLIEGAEAEENQPQVLASFGYKNKEEWLYIQCSFYRYWFGQGGKVNPDDVDVDMSNPQWTQAGMNARMRQQQEAQQAAAQADPNLTAPVEGMTIEQWAQAASAIASAANDPNAMAQAMARMGIDKPKWDRVNAAFMQKMQGDSTGAIATIYGKAFTQAQGVQGGYGAGAVDGSAQQLGGEPVSLEKYAEINAAMGVWAEQGADVNANLQQVFSLTPVQLSNYGGYWSTKFTSDIQVMTQYTDLMDKYKSKYAGADLDDDLDDI